MAGFAGNAVSSRYGTTSTTSARGEKERTLSANAAKFKMLTGARDIAASTTFRRLARAAAVVGLSKLTIAMMPCNSGHGSAERATGRIAGGTAFVGNDSASQV